MSNNCALVLLELRQCTSRNMYWRRFSEDIVSAARHLFTYTSVMVRWIYCGALDGPQTTEAPYATLLTYFGIGRMLLGKQLVRRRKPPLSGFLRKCILSIWCTSRTGMTIFRHLFSIYQNGSIIGKYQIMKGKLGKSPPTTASLL